MTCKICEQKAENCDCTKGEKLLFSQLEDAEMEIENLKHLLRESQTYLQINDSKQWKLYLAISEAIGIKK